MKYLPNFIEGKNGDIYVSHADFICPDDCPEPDDFCFFTGQERKRNMHDLLKEIDLPGFRPIVVRSHQLAHGVGGCTNRSSFYRLYSKLASPEQESCYVRHADVMA